MLIMAVHLLNADATLKLLKKKCIQNRQVELKVLFGTIFHCYIFPKIIQIVQNNIPAMYCANTAKNL